MRQEIYVGLGWTDGAGRFCRSRRNNLGDAARFTGFDLDGGYTEFVAGDERFFRFSASG